MPFEKYHLSSIPHKNTASIRRHNRTSGGGRHGNSESTHAMTTPRNAQSSVHAVITRDASCRRSSAFFSAVQLDSDFVQRGLA